MATRLLVCWLRDPTSAEGHPRRCRAPAHGSGRLREIAGSLPCWSGPASCPLFRPHWHPHRRLTVLLKVIERSGERAAAVRERVGSERGASGDGSSGMFRAAPGAAGLRQVRGRSGRRVNPRASGERGEKKQRRAGARGRVWGVRTCERKGCIFSLFTPRIFTLRYESWQSSKWDPLSAVEKIQSKVLKTSPTRQNGRPRSSKVGIRWL
jgi:hypothetical protein